MTQRSTTTPAMATDGGELESLRTAAVSVLNAHVSDDGLCGVCGRAWPCERVLLAEHNLAVL